MEYIIPRIVLAGTNSGCGKTTVTCAVLQALVNRKLKVGAFKCGPDYIDPMFHSRIIGARSSNLDLFFFQENTLKCCSAFEDIMKSIPDNSCVAFVVHGGVTMSILEAYAYPKKGFYDYRIENGKNIFCQYDNCKRCFYIER